MTTSDSPWEVDPKTGFLYRRIEGKGLCFIGELHYIPRWFWYIPQFFNPIEKYITKWGWGAKLVWGVWFDVNYWKKEGLNSGNMTAHFETKDQAIDFAERGAK
jgi:hypothetical protein